MTELRDSTLAGWLDHHARARPGAPALVDADGELSYSQLRDDVARLATGLAGLGLGRGDVLGVQLPNTRGCVTAFLAAAARGAVLQTLHMPYRSNEIRELLGDSSAKMVVVTNAPTDSRAADVLAVREDLPKLKKVIVAGEPIDGCTALADILATEAAPEAVVESSTDDRYLLLYTSGTTSAPKGVPHPYRGFLNNALDATRELEIGAESRILTLAPITHLYGLFTMNLVLASGAAMVLVPAFNPKTVLDDIKSARASHVFSAPAHFAPLIAQGLVKPEALSGIKGLCLSGSPVPRDLAKAVDGLMEDGGVFQLWGMSELQAGSYGRLGDAEEKRFTTAGAASPGTELRVVGDDGSPLAPGTEGALQVRGPSVFDGYLNRPEETALAFGEDGWFSTGDLAVVDGDGYMAITGRTKEIINRGGVKFNPVEVEEVLSGLGAIQQCAVIPVPDPDLGERGCLCVELAPESSLTLDEALAALEAHGMAKYKWPERLEILDQLPMTPTRKVMRGKLAETILQQETGT